MVLVYLFISVLPELKAKGSIWTRAYFVASTGNLSSETIQKYIEEQGG